MSFEEVARNYEQIMTRERLSRETDLEYLRRIRPDMTDEARIAYLLWNAIAGKSVRLSGSEAGT